MGRIHAFFLASFAALFAAESRADDDTPSPSCFRESFRQASPVLSDFRLSLPGIDVSTISAKVDGALVSHAYASSRNEVQLAQAGARGSLVELRYCLPSYASGCEFFGCDPNGI
jgi:hypothetical protein